LVDGRGTENVFASFNVGRRTLAKEGRCQQRPHSQEEESQSYVRRATCATAKLCEEEVIRWTMESISSIPLVAMCSLEALQGHDAITTQKSGASWWRLAMPRRGLGVTGHRSTIHLSAFAQESLRPGAPLH
jgi:hypothetical protein